jgi:hypothetical protein
MSLPKSAEHVIAAIMGLTSEIRYAALASGQDVAMHQRARVSRASAGDSDRFEGLLVNPALLTWRASAARSIVAVCGISSSATAASTSSCLLGRTDTPRSRSSVGRIPPRT